MNILSRQGARLPNISPESKFWWSRSIFVQLESEIVEWGLHFEDYSQHPCPVFMVSKLFSVSLKDKFIMAGLLKGTEFIPKSINVTQENPRYEDVEKKTLYLLLC